MAAFLSPHEHAARAARVRWQDHTPTVVKLDALTDSQRRLVLALVRAARSDNETTSAVEKPEVVSAEVRRASDTTP